MDPVYTKHIRTHVIFVFGIHRIHISFGGLPEIFLLGTIKVLMDMNAFSGFNDSFQGIETHFHGSQDFDGLKVDIRSFRGLQYNFNLRPQSSLFSIKNKGFIVF